MSRRMLAIALACLPVVAAATDDAPTVRYADGRLSVHADHAPLATILADVARATGARLRGTPPDRELSIDLREVRLEEALIRVLGKDNFALVYAPDGRVRTIELLGEAANVPSWPPLGPGASETQAGVDPERQREVMGRTVPVTGRLAAALGTSHPTAGQLVHAALLQKSGRVRAEAQERLLVTFDKDPEIEEVFLRTLGAIDDATLARMLRGMGAAHAEELMTKLASRARSEELRGKAAAVLERLRAPADDAG